ncbi:hypothetical protein H8356DRAFT_1434523 [Neocallimastix lanati (nom. inval.)]|nr:hypothetical protein H8356DRAFT_1434523 [Neocallimastix sp. JGI-2020a]
MILKPKRIIYEHLSEETWSKVEYINTTSELWDFLKKRKEILKEALNNWFIKEKKSGYMLLTLRIYGSDILSQYLRIDPSSMSFKQNYSDVYERLTLLWLLCGSTEYFINQCNMWNLFKNWKKVIQEKLKEKERVLREEIIIMKPAKKI